MAANLNPKNPLMMGALALGAFWLVTRPKAKAATGTEKLVRNGEQTYSTPTNVAAALGAFVAMYTKGASATAVRADNVPTFGEGITFAGTAQETAKAWTQAGTNWLNPTAFGAAPEAWSGPTLSFVNSPASGIGSMVDAIPQASLYDLTTDFVQNPFLLSAP